MDLLFDDLLAIRRLKQKYDCTILLFLVNGSNYTPGLLIDLI